MSYDTALLTPPDTASQELEELAYLAEKPVYEWVKRAMDIVLSVIAIIALSPVFLLAAILVRIDGTPVIFKQTRVGQSGKPFAMYKFRSMTTISDNNALKNEMDGPVFKMARDPRITPIGRFIRKYSIDEMPQFINVIKGEMTLVGPRPALPKEVSQYNSHQRRRLQVKPGLTCYWQCSGRNNIGFARWVELDLEYIEKRSIITDLVILFRTVPAVITGKGAR